MHRSMLNQTCLIYSVLTIYDRPVKLARILALYGTEVNKDVGKDRASC